MRKPLAILIGFIIGYSAYSQPAGPVELNWKIGPDETLTYKTIMSEIDTAAMQFDFSKMFEGFDIDSNETAQKLHKRLRKLNESFKDIDLFTQLTNSGQETIDVVIKTQPKQGLKDTNSDDAESPDMMEMMQSMNQGVMLRGSVYENGGIHSFWVKSKQRNLIALLCELPTKPVVVGDSWSLDVNLITNDQNFMCDSSHKEVSATLFSLKRSKAETIAIIKYQIEEYVDGTFYMPSMFGRGGSTPTMMHFNFQAIAEFSVDKGRWVSYDGILALEAAGVMTANSKQKFSLIPE